MTAAKKITRAWCEVTNEKLIAYDPAAALVDDEEIAFLMADAVETGDSDYIARARDAVAVAKKVLF